MRRTSVLALATLLLVGCGDSSTRLWVDVDGPGIQGIPRLVVEVTSYNVDGADRTSSGVVSPPPGEYAIALPASFGLILENAFAGTVDIIIRADEAAPPAFGVAKAVALTLGTLNSTSVTLFPDDIVGDSGTDGGVTDSNSDAGDSTVDGGIDALGTFGPPTVVTELDVGADDDDPTLTADGLELYFNSNRPGGIGGSDIWVTYRAGTSEPWDPPVVVAEVSASASDTNPVVSADGLTLWLSSRRGGLSSQDIWLSVRASRSDPWSTPVAVAELNTSEDESVGAVSPDGLTMYLHRGISNSYGEIFVCNRASESTPWSTPTPVTELNGGDIDVAPWVSPGGFHVFWNSDRNDAGDLFRASRIVPTSAFGGPVPISELNTANAEEDPWLTPDLRTIYFVRGPPPRTIYMATR